jgi:hypothetical protein
MSEPETESAAEESVVTAEKEEETQKSK